MTDLNDIIAIADKQDAGAELVIINPITQELTDLKFWIAGPDSNVAQDAKNWAADRARREHVLQLPPAMANAAEVREITLSIAVGMLARYVVRWDVRQNGEPVPFTIKNAERVLASSRIIRDQIDAFAASRDPWIPKKVDPVKREAGDAAA
ncbi:MAG: hypothetical protein JNK84_17915 [Phreatobacter sp.]|uniref:hypothetical protein n=1 Tax=Phreatobacter sp. TaxID=1966341 RepID=UPI001A4A10B1|nr:hypothetical protein [Phreatobacter sp.]MBL8570950.1 hypothetical protein [Phreatobacter sp.]